MKNLVRDNQIRLEMRIRELLVEFAPQGTHFTLLAERGYGKVELYECCATLDIDYTICLRDVTLATEAEGNKEYHFALWTTSSADVTAGHRQEDPDVSRRRDKS